jgi:hypothetical protein
MGKVGMNWLLTALAWLVQLQQLVARRLGTTVEEDASHKETHGQLTERQERAVADRQQLEHKLKLQRLERAKQADLVQVRAFLLLFYYFSCYYFYYYRRLGAGEAWSKAVGLVGSLIIYSASYFLYCESLLLCTLKQLRDSPVNPIWTQEVHEAQKVGTAFKSTVGVSLYALAQVHHAGLLPRLSVRRPALPLCYVHGKLGLKL